MLEFFVYILFFLIGIFVPFPLLKLIPLYILSIAFDEFRVYDISITNLFSIIIISRYLTVNYRINLKKFSIVSLILILFLLSTLTSFIVNFNHNSIKYFISISLLIINTLIISSLIKYNQYRKIIFKYLIILSLISALSVIIESLLYYLFGIQTRENLFGLINLATYFYFSSGLYSSNGIASFHILPGLILIIYNGVLKTHLKIVLFIIVSIGILLTMARGAMIVLLIIMLHLIFKFLRKSSNKIKIIGYSLILLSFLYIINFIVFISNFNISSIIARTNIIKGSLESISKNPFFGSGPGARIEAKNVEFSIIDIENISSEVINDSSLRETHNTIFQIAVEFGLISFFMFFGLIVYLIFKHLVNSSRLQVQANQQYNLLSLYLIVFTLIALNMNSYLYFKIFWITIAYTSFTQKKIDLL